MYLQKMKCHVQVLPGSPALQSKPSGPSPWGQRISPGAQKIWAPWPGGRHGPGFLRCEEFRSFRFVFLIESLYGFMLYKVFMAFYGLFICLLDPCNMEYNDIMIYESFWIIKRTLENIGRSAWTCAFLSSLPIGTTIWSDVVRRFFTWLIRAKTLSS